ncbi:winged helix-turn-helix transcriptional regulator [Halobaculum sp. D14]|uniref:winged helix-turn-helix transcriptional regulator n=1 Tax=Halobaculum sp. D14 TaxID=3421642 RepID=UPI003EBB1BE7
MASNTDTGKQRVADSEIVELFQNTEEPFRTPGDIASAVPISRQAVNSRLRKLAEEGTLQRRKVGGAAVVYWAE